MSTNFYGLDVTPKQMARNLKAYEKLVNFQWMGNARHQGMADYLLTFKPQPIYCLVKFNTNTGKLMSRQKKIKLSKWRKGSGLGLLKEQATELGEWIVNESSEENAKAFANKTAFASANCLTRRGLKDLNRDGRDFHELIKSYALDRERFHAFGKWMVKSGGFFWT